MWVVVGSKLFPVAPAGPTKKQLAGKKKHHHLKSTNLNQEYF